MLDYLCRSDCEDPVATLKEYQEQQMRGRALDILDENVLQSNFNRAYKRASSRLRLLKSVREYLDINVATKIFNMMILPILSYAGPIKLTYTQTQKDCLISLLRGGSRGGQSGHATHVKNAQVINIQS